MKPLFSNVATGLRNRERSDGEQTISYTEPKPEPMDV